MKVGKKQLFLLGKYTGNVSYVFNMKLNEKGGSLILTSYNFIFDIKRTTFYSNKYEKGVASNSYTKFNEFLNKKIKY